MWNYEGYWNAVLGATRTADDVVAEFELVGGTRAQLDEWLDSAEAESWAMGAENNGKDLPDEWGGFHTRALAELADAAEKVQCECGTAIGEPCQWSGPRSEMVLLEWMPEHLRDSHTAAGNHGEYPHNGAVRLRVALSCAEFLEENDSDWTTEVGP